jgi:hypothetical protein
LRFLELQFLPRLPIRLGARIASDGAEQEETMRLGQVLALVLGGAVLGASIYAQQAEKKPSAGGPAMDMAKPAPEMEKRKWVVGKWSVTETHEKSEWSPGGIGRGTSVIALGPGGHSQTITYNSTGPTGTFSGHGIIAWDPEASAYRSAWADSMTRGIVTMYCREDGKDWVCLGESMMQGKKTTVRSRSLAPNPAGWTELMEISTDGGPFTKMRTFEFNRAK